MYYFKFLGKVAIAGLLFAGIPCVSQNTNAQTVLVSIADKNGKSISIAREDLALTIDGKQAEITALAPAVNEPLGFGLLLDVSGSMRDKVDFSKNASNALFSMLSKGSGQGYFGIFADKYAVSAKAISPSEAKKTIDSTVPHGGSSLLAALTYTLENRIINGFPEIRRRSVIVITDGGENASQVSLNSTIEIAQRNGITIVVVGLLSEDNSLGGERNQKPLLKQLASQTGGLPILLDGPGDYIHRVQGYFEQQYFLSFTSPIAPDAQLHSFQLVSSKKGARIEAPSEILLK